MPSNVRNIHEFSPIYKEYNISQEWNNSSLKTIRIIPKIQTPQVQLSRTHKNIIVPTLW